MLRSGSRSAVLAVAAVLVVLGPGAVGAEVVWPEQRAWEPITRAAEPVVDELGDAEEALDLVGTPAHPAAFFADDEEYLYFRLRLDGDPSTAASPLALLPHVWTVLFELDGRAQDYELAARIDARAEPAAVELWRNGPQAHVNDPMDEPEERLLRLTPLGDHVRVRSAVTDFHDTRDHFLDLALARAALWAAGWDEQLEPIRYAFVTSADGNTLGDLLAPDRAHTLAAAFSDTALCEGSACRSCIVSAACGAACTPCPASKPVCFAGASCVEEADGGNDLDGNRLAGGPVNGCATGGGGFAWLAVVGVALFLALSLARRRRGRWLAALALLGLPASASAAELEARASVERLRPTMFGDGVAVTGTASEVTSPLRFQLLAHYASAPLVVVDGDGDRLAEAISDRLTLDLMGTVGLTDWLAFGARLPLVWQQGDADAFSLVGETGSALDEFGLGDPELALHARLLRPEDAGLGVALLVAGTIPNDGGASFLGESGGTVSPTVALSRPLGDRARLGLDLGFTARENVEGDVALDAGDELFASLGGLYALGGGVSLIGELLGGTGSADPFTSEGTSLEALGAVRADLLWGFQGLVGAGAGILDGYGVPEYRVLAGLGWRLGAWSAPAEEGPEPLAEEEGWIEPERVVEVEAVLEPEPAPVVVTPEPVVEPEPEPVKAAPRREELRERVLFASGRADLGPEARRQLDALVQRIGAAAAAKIAVSLEGHADPVGDADANRRLSERRVRSVAEYLKGKGAPAPVKEDAYGEARTASDHEEPRAQDRRVDVMVVLEE